MSPIEHQITELWGQITAATYRFLELVGEYDESGAWGPAGAGIMSCAHWLNVYCGIGMNAAREKVRVAKAIRELPQISAAFREGRVSYSKVRAMTRVATPENEPILLNIAIHGTAAHVERTASYFRRVQRIEEAARAAELHRKRFLDFRIDDDEHLVIHGRLPIEVGRLVEHALERAMKMTNSDPTPAGDEVSAETSRLVEGAVPEDDYPIGARRADALREVAAQFLNSDAALTGSTADRYQVVVHIDQRSLCDQPPEGRVLAELEDGPALAIEVARRLACDATLVGMVDDEHGEPLSVGRKTRTLTPALKRALKARDRGCRFPGCSNTRFTEGHHIEHWADGGETSLSNLVTLCYFHHHLVHEGGFSIERTDDGVFLFRGPDNYPIKYDFAVEKSFSGNALAESNRNHGIEIRPDTVVTLWQGETMDYSLAIDALLSARDRASAAQTGSCPGSDRPRPSR